MQVTNIIIRYLDPEGRHIIALALKYLHRDRLIKAPKYMQFRLIAPGCMVRSDLSYDLIG